MSFNRQIKKNVGKAAFEDLLRNLSKEIAEELEATQGIKVASFFRRQQSPPEKLAVINNIPPETPTSSSTTKKETTDTVSACSDISTQSFRARGRVGADGTNY